MAKEYTIKCIYMHQAIAYNIETTGIQDFLIDKPATEEK